MKNTKAFLRPRMIRFAGSVSVLMIVLVSLTGARITERKAADNYKVIKVFGTIVVKKTGSALAQGDVISASETIIFKTTDAKASVISEKTGRFVLSPGGKQEASLKSNLLPAMSNMSSRNGSLLNLVDLQAYFNGNNVILDEVRMYISPQSFPMNDNSFFYVQYEYKNEKINKKLPFKGDSLTINRDQLFTIDGAAVQHPEHIGASLYYFSNNISSLITQVNLVFPAHSQLKNEVQIILGETKQKTYKEKTNEVISYLNEFYGKPDAQNVKEWLARNTGLSE